MNELGIAMTPKILVKLLLGVGPAEAPPREKRLYYASLT